MRATLVLMCLVLFAPAAVGQTTGPTFNAPYRAFAQSEVGGTIAFPDGGGTILEGQYRFGRGTFDVGVRGGFLLPGGGQGESFVAGIVLRNRVLTHSEQLPFDGAVVFGAGVDINGGTSWVLPIGLSLGRRLVLEGSDVSIVPYVQPTGWIFRGGGTTDFEIGAGFGADFRLSSLFDGRVSIGVGNGFQGISFSAVWVH